MQFVNEICSEEDNSDKNITSSSGYDGDEIICLNQSEHEKSQNKSSFKMNSYGSDDNLDYFEKKKTEQTKTVHMDLEDSEEVEEVQDRNFINFNEKYKDNHSSSSSKYASPIVSSSLSYHDIKSDKPSLNSSYSSRESKEDTLKSKRPRLDSPTLDKNSFRAVSSSKSLFRASIDLTDDMSE